MSPFWVMRFEELTDKELLCTIEAEIAKTRSELDSIEQTAIKIRSRMGFSLALVHYLKNKD